MWEKKNRFSRYLADNSKKKIYPGGKANLLNQKSQQSAAPHKDMCKQSHQCTIYITQLFLSASKPKKIRPWTSKLIPCQSCVRMRIQNLDITISMPLDWHLFLFFSFCCLLANEFPLLRKWFSLWRGSRPSYGIHPSATYPVLDVFLEALSGDDSDGMPCSTEERNLCETSIDMQKTHQTS